MWPKIVLVFLVMFQASAVFAQTGWPVWQPTPEQTVTWPESPSNIDAANPWLSWELCNLYGSICYDCNTVLKCNKNQAKLKLCNDPFLPYCYLGKCYARPYGECAVPSRADEPETESANEAATEDSA